MFFFGRTAGEVWRGVGAGMGGLLCARVSHGAAHRKKNPAAAAICFANRFLFMRIPFLSKSCYFIFTISLPGRWNVARTVWKVRDRIASAFASTRGEPVAAVRFEKSAGGGAGERSDTYYSEQALLHGTLRPPGSSIRTRRTTISITLPWITQRNAAYC